MSGSKKIASATAAGMALLLMVLAGAAWACTPQAPLHIVGPAFGVQGAKVSVETNIPHPGVAEGTAELRWNSAQGPLLATATDSTGGNLSIDFTVPDAAPGVYYLLLVSKGSGVARAPFEVVSTSGPSASGASAPSSSAKAVAGGLWSGLGAAHAGDLAQQAPGWTEQTNPGLTTGLGLLAAGSVALAGGLSVAVVRSRRVRAHRWSE